MLGLSVRHLFFAGLVCAAAFAFAPQAQALTTRPDAVGAMLIPTTAAPVMLVQYERPAYHNRARHHSRRHYRHRRGHRQYAR